jgi:hypothetical protein
MSSSGEIRRRRNVAGRQHSSPSDSMRSETTPLTQHIRSGSSTNAAAAAASRSDPTTSDSNAHMKSKEYDEYAWFAVFLLAAAYFVITRRGGGIHHSRGGLLTSFSEPYEISASSVSVSEGRNSNHEEMMRSIFYIANNQKGGSSSSLTLAHNHQLEVVLSSPPDLQECHKAHSNSNEQAIPFLSHLASTTWVHDEDLGRGYLLLSDAGRSGRIWRWEVGGGPITIGRSLHMERSGCRSGLWVNNNDDGNTNMMTINQTSCPENIFTNSICVQSSCTTTKTAAEVSPPLLGSPSLAVELTRDAERASIGKNIAVAEWGEKRIIRVEGESGARTPLVVLVPPPKNHDKALEKEEEQLEDTKQSEQVSSEWVRIQRPNHLTYTPFGDLLFSDNRDNGVGIVYRLKDAVHAQPISAEQSRVAHGWTKITMEDQDGMQDNIDILFQINGTIGGLALGSDYSVLYILVATPSGKTVYQLSLDSDEDDEDDGSGGTTGEGLKEGVSVFYKMASENCGSDQTVEAKGANLSVGSKLSVDAKGTLYVITCPSSVTLLSTEKGQGVAIGSLSSQGSSDFTSVGFGEDGFLYITSSHQLLRVKNRIGGMTLPTNLVVPPPSKPMKNAVGDENRRQKRDKK